MKFVAHIDVMPQKEILDPQGKAVQLGLHNLGVQAVSDVRIGKHITVALEAASESEANAQVEEACRKLLANLIMEDYSFRLEQV
ncbi:phosphoribosylformylglycinamidine synthase [Flexibacter flexilis DSM 6793]|uniref:Phosphoribosylformylglycinamidine synthase subunit PurS n=1 Tax=Flexibacter flexilis DSM 6793 TaxID=927664 RepID=A0A1I1JX15_9BACT|nr:phosphoribosylformylglycinamidine synthase subunit PurS [Flexibacter flexilis]SFC53046.1 phosphoribosylformylglycinamidine synthase [Flexibacter flexilis DSM 6793]